jgi:tight adherence protein B
MIFFLVSVLVFGAVVAAVVAITIRRQEQEADSLRDRVGADKRGHGKGPAPLAIERDTRMSSVPFLDRALQSMSVARKLEMLLYQAGATMRVGMFLLIVAAVAMVTYLIGYIVFGHVIPAFVCMAVGSLVLPLIMWHKRNVRMNAFAEEFPDALDLLVSALRAGISFSSALQIVADESPEPIRSEFAIVVEEQSLGIEMREALTNLANRVDSVDIKFFVTAIVLQRDTGGNLTEVLDNTSRLIRDRFRILGDIKTFTAQGRLTGFILTCLPLAMALFMIASAPDYFFKMWEKPEGRTILGVAALMQLMGGLAIRKIVDIKV